MERRGFLKGAMALFGLGGAAKAVASEPEPVKVEKRVVKINLKDIPVWIDEEQLMDEMGLKGEKFLKRE